MDNFGQNSEIGESFYWLKPFYSESNSFLEIKARNDVMPCDQEQKVQVDYILNQNKLSSGTDHIDFYYTVIAKGRILFSGKKQVPIPQHENLHGSFSLTLTIGNDFLPDIKLLVYTLFLDGQVVADMEEFQVAKCFRHKVELDFSSKQEVPESKVSLNLKAAPGSLCSVQSVDKSVLLMENDTLTADILYKKFFENDSFTIGGRGFPYHLEDFDAYPCLPQKSNLTKKTQMGAPWYQSDADVFNLFKLLRMKIVTNTKIKKPVSCMQQNFERKMLSNKDGVVDSYVIHANLVPQSADTEKPKPRTYFPETWIWDLVSVSGEGQASLQVTVPDTITEWNANIFCVADSGFGLSHLATLRVFQPFFVDLSLPYSVIQGEIFSLKAIVFNYLKDCIQVHTTLIETPELKVDACPGCQFTSCLCANEAKIFAWNVTATRLGKVNVTVSSVAEDSHNLCDNRVAVTPLQGKTDTVIKPLIVKPGGILQEKTQNAFLCATDNTVSEEFSLTLPEETLEGSGRATFSVIGDIMGPALQNLDQLLKMPFGCGEQNMVQFAPNIFILQYLKKTKQLDPEIEVSALYCLRTGYQRQLLYKHDDGSYSAFGKSDTQGNTWLTAFVARSFGQASSYIYISKNHVQDAVLWLQKHQLSNGCFQSVGKLFNNDLKCLLVEDVRRKKCRRALCSEVSSPSEEGKQEMILGYAPVRLGLRVNGELITAYPQVVVVRVPTPWVQSDSDITVLRHLEKMGCRLMNRPQAILNCVNKFWTFQELAGHGVPLPDTFSYGGHENFAKMIDEAEVLEFPMVVKNTRGHRGKAVFLARDKHHLADLSHLIRHDAPYLFQKYVKESHGKDVRVIVVGGRVVGTMLRCSTDGRMQSNCSLGGVGMMCSLSEQGKQLAIQVSNILGMDVCGIDLLMKDDGSFYVCEANANVGFIAFDKACNLDVAGIIADYATSLLTPGRLTRRMSLLSVVSTASETSEPELGPPASAVVDNMSASSSSVDSDPETTERELLTKLPGALFNMNQLLANEIKLLVE